MIVELAKLKSSGELVDERLHLYWVDPLGLLLLIFDEQLFAKGFINLADLENIHLRRVMIRVQILGDRLDNDIP